MKTAIISGGSSGIGKATAESLAKKGFIVYELSRSGMSTDLVKHVTCDITDENEVKKAVELIIKESKGVDLLINNAGYGISGAIEFTDLNDTKKLFDVNFFGAVSLTRALIPHLRESKGRIINVSSIGGIFGLPYQAFYSATKYALNGYSLALSNELKKFGVSVCSVLPGDTKTCFTKNRLRKESGETVYGDSIKRSVDLMEKDEKNGMSAEKVGEYITKIATKRRVKPTYAVGFKYKAFAFLSKILPLRLVNYIVGKIYAK